MRLLRVWVLGACLGLAACAGASGEGRSLSPKSAHEARAESTTEDVRALAAGRVLSQSLSFERGEHRYVGGIARVLVAASQARILEALDDPDAIRAILPKTRRVTRIEPAGSPVRRLELLQGNRWIEAVYTVTFEPAGPGTVAFRLDRTRPHDIDDVYGFFQLERFDDERTLVTVAAAADIGSDFVHLLFAGKVQELILAMPLVMRDYFARDRTKPPAQVALAR